MKITATPSPTVSTARLARRVRDEVLSSRTVERLERELTDELDAVSFSERTADADTRRDALERAVRRVWGATL
jgi:hypothetical protein